jgi:hypothetical protein
MSPFAAYLFGLLVLVGGLAVAAYLLNVPTIAVVVAVALALVAIGAWSTRRIRARPSKFTGTTPTAPSLEPTMLMELKTTLMEQPDKARNAPTTRIESQDPARMQPTTRLERPTSASKRERSDPPEQ